LLEWLNLFWQNRLVFNSPDVARSSVGVETSLDAARKSARATIR